MVEGNTSGTGRGSRNEDVELKTAPGRVLGLPTKRRDEGRPKRKDGKVRRPTP